MDELLTPILEASGIRKEFPCGQVSAGSNLSWFRKLPGHHSPGHIYRTLAEGIAYGTRSATQAIEALGGRFLEIIVAGGIRGNRVWLQATADVLQRPIVLTAEPEASLLGAAIAAATASGAYSGLAEAAKAMVRRERVIEPDPSLRDVYGEGFAAYTTTPALLRETLHGLALQADRSAVTMEVRVS